MTANQWFDNSILSETSIKSFYFPSINLKNFKSFNKKFLKLMNIILMKFQLYPMI